VANRRITEFPAIAANDIVDQDVMTLVHVFEADPTLRNKKITFSGFKDYLDVYYVANSGAVISGNVTITGNLTVGGNASFNTVAASGLSTFSGIVVQNNATISGIVSGDTLTGTYLQGSLLNAGTGTFGTLATGATASFSTGNFTSLTGTTASGVNTFFTNATFTNVTGVTFTGTTVAATTGTFQTLSTPVLNISGNLSVASGLTVTGTAQFTSGVQVTGTLSGTTVTGTAARFTTVTGVTGVFTTTLSGATITGTAVRATSITGATGTFTARVSGALVTGNTGSFGNVSGISGVFTQFLSGAVITGDAGRFTAITGVSGVFTNLSGITVTGDSVNATHITGVSGVFTSRISGATLTGNTGQFTTITGGTIVGTTSVSGGTVTGNTGQFTTVTGATVVGTTSVSGATVTGNTVLATNLTGQVGTFTTSISGTSITGNTVLSTSGRFQNISGLVITGDTVQAGTLSAVSGVFTNIVFSNTVVSGNLSVLGTGIFSTGGIVSSGTISGSRFTTTGVISGGTFSGGIATFTTITGGVATITSGVFATGNTTNPSISFSGDSNTGIYSPLANQLAITTAGVERVEWGPDEVVFNDGGVNYDFRIEGDTNQTLFYVDASVDKIGIGTAPVYGLLDIYSNTASELINLWSNNGAGGVQQTFIYNNSTIGGIGSAKYWDSTLSLNDLGVTSTGNLDFVANQLFRLRITSAGRVGINTKTPDDILHIHDTIGTTTLRLSQAATLGSSDSNMILFESENYIKTATIIHTANSSANTLQIGGVTDLYFDGDQQIFRDTAGTTSLFIGTDGQVAVGKLLTPNVPDLAFVGDPNTGVSSPDDDQLAIITAGVERANWGTTEVVFNDDGVNYDFRIEGDTNANLFFVDASADRVGVGTSAPSTLLHLSSATGDATPTPTELRIATTTASSSWSTTNPWGRISFYSADTSGAGPKIHAALDVIQGGAAGSSSSFSFKTSSTTTDTLTERLKIDFAGNVGIGNVIPAYALDVASSDTTANIGYALRLRANDTALASAIQFTNSAGTTQSALISATTSTNASPRVLTFNALGGLVATLGTSEAARIDSSGRLLVGWNNAIAIGSFTPTLQNIGSSTQNSSIALSAFSTTDDIEPRLNFTKSATATIGANALVANGESLGSIRFHGSQTAGYIQAATIECYVDGDPETSGDVSDMPGRIVLKTTADGSQTPVERVRITSAGNVGIATTAPAALAHIAGDSIVSNVDLANASYDSILFSVAAEETTPTGLFFSPNGRKMFVIGSAGDDINEYTLSTPWNVSTATYVTVFSVSAQDTAPNDLYFRNDGKKLYVIGGTNDSVYQYSLTTPWSIASASYDSISFSVVTEEAGAGGLSFKPDGLAFYIVGTGNDTVYRYNLSTAWNISTATLANSFSVSGQESAPNAVTFTVDGSRMFVMGVTGDDINIYNLTTPWDITTASFVTAFSVAGQETIPTGLFVKPDGTKFYILGTTNDTVYQYSIPSATIDLTGTTNINGNVNIAQNLTINGEIVGAGVLTLSTADTGDSPTEQMRIDSTGLVTLAGPGIKFPATQVASSDPNTLDDYEEGSFTPVIEGLTTPGTGTYSTQIGRYTKIGRSVQFYIFLAWSAHTGTGDIKVTGLPFTSLSTGNAFSALSVRPSNYALTANNVMVAYVSNNSIDIIVNQYPAGGGGAAVVPMDTSASIMLAGHYVA
jgi:sugar lactone lactonase YvrE